MALKPIWIAIRNVGAPPRDGPPYIGTGNELSDFIHNVGRTPEVVGWYMDFTETFSTLKANAVRSIGATPSLTFEPWDHTMGPVQPAYQLSVITGGAYDVYLTALANAIKNWGHPICFRLAQEMNGNWYPWGVFGGHNGNTAADFVAFWQHVRGIFNGVGVTNAVWQWCVNADPAHVFEPIAGLYPGDAWTEEVGFDAYNFGPLSIEGWLTPFQLYETTRLDIHAISSRPLRILETSSVEWVPQSPNLEDTFTGPTLDTGKWNGSSYGFVSQSGNRGIIPTTVAYYVIGTNTPKFDLTGHFFQAQMFPPAVGGGTRETFLQAALDSNNLVQWMRSGTDFFPMIRVGGVNTPGPSLVYDATAHAYWRVAESGGSLVFSTSPDGVTQTIRWIVAVPFAINLLDIVIGSGFYGAEGAAQAEVDNFTSNLLRPIPEGNKPGWIGQMCVYLDNHPDIISALWFDFDNGLDTPGQPNFLYDSSEMSKRAYVQCYNPDKKRILRCCSCQC